MENLQKCCKIKLKTGVILTVNLLEFRSLFNSVNRLIERLHSY